MLIEITYTTDHGIRGGVVTDRYDTLGHAEIDISNGISTNHGTRSLEEFNLDGTRTGRIQIVNFSRVVKAFVRELPQPSEYAPEPQDTIPVLVRADD